MGRAFGFISVLIVCAAGMYIYMQQTKALSPTGLAGKGANPQATIDIAGVKRDLVQFAKAEQQHLASDGKYLSLDEMRSGGDTGLPADSRGPFRYTLDVSGTSFTVTATYMGQTMEGVPQTMRIGPDMQIVTQ